MGGMGAAMGEQEAPEKKKCKPSLPVAKIKLNDKRVRKVAAAVVVVALAVRKSQRKFIYEFCLLQEI